MAQNDKSGDEEEIFELDPVIVTGSRIPLTVSETGQSVEVIYAKQFREIPVNSVDEVLKFIAGMDIRQRGIAGVQSDVSIRGSSFEQTLILVDGMAMNDPQSGHHNMNLPVNLEDIDRIEIIKGASSRSYGPNAMGGVINIITRKGKNFAVRINAKYGSNNLQNYGLSIPFNFYNTFHSISVNHKSSDGYIGKNLNDFTTSTLHYGFDWEPFPGWQFHLGAGYADKDFGAYKYYFESIPEQREKTKTTYAFGNFNFEGEHFYLHQKSYYRKGEDNFSYPIDNGTVENRHKTSVYGGQLDFGFYTWLGKTNFGINYANEEISSNTLGNDKRYRFGYTLEHRFRILRKLSIGLGVTGLDYDKYGRDFWPGMDFIWNINDITDLHGSVDKGFRMPSFTELYYSDPGNVGNADLKPESIFTYEIGLRNHLTGINTNLAVFYKDGRDILDWVKEDDGKYYVRNFANITFAGVEAELEVFPDWNLILIRWDNAFVNYTYLYSDLDTMGKDSKYVLNNFRHQLNAGITLHYFKYFYHWISIRINQRVGEDYYTVADTRLGLKLSLFDIYAEVNNLLDIEYFEAGFAPMPGRRITLGMRISFGGE
jgi:iron complex outermembrane receptor protein